MQKRTEIKAFMNCGRWIILCQRCGVGLMADEKGTVCPVCYPDIRAKALQPIANGLFRQVHDMEIINQARASAEKNSELYFPVFPKERNEIESILRLRPRKETMNWDETESVADLIEQNREHDDPVPARKKGRT